MGIDTEPSAEYIVKLAKTLEARYSGQTALNREAKFQYLGENIIEAKRPDSEDMDVHRVKTGMAGSMVDEKTAVLLGDLFLRVTPRGAGEAEGHASDKLEPFLNGALNVMQEDGAVIDDAVQDMGVFGVFCTRGPMPAPQLWGDEEIQKLSGDMVDADTQETYKEAKDAVSAFMKNTFPIIWEHVPADSVYPVFRRKNELAEIVQVREMQRQDVESEWGEILEDKKENFTVYEYANQRFVATVVADSTPKRVRMWEHNMRVGGKRVVPYVFEVAHKLPAGDSKGRLWRGLLFHLKSLFESIDEVMTDLKTNFREYATAPPWVTMDVDARSELEGWPTRETVEQGKTVYLLKGEMPGRWPVPEMTDGVYQFLDRAKAYSGQLGADRPQLHGGGPSGESAVRLAQANAMAKSELRRSHRALERAGGQVGRLIFSSVIALNQHFPDEDEVVVRHKDAKHKSKEISVTSKDVIDYFHLTSADADLNIPFNESAAVQNASVAVQSRVLDPHTAREMFLNIENPQEIDDRWAEYDFTQAGIQVANAQLIQEFSGSVAAGDIPISELLQRAGSLPEAAQMAIQQMLAQGGGQVPRGVSTGMENQAREGRGQRMSQPVGAQETV